MTHNQPLDEDPSCQSTRIFGRNYSLIRAGKILEDVVPQLLFCSMNKRNNKVNMQLQTSIHSFDKFVNNKIAFNIFVSYAKRIASLRVNKTSTQ